MKRRDFIVLLGGAAVAWPLVASAQRQAAGKRSLVAVLVGASQAASSRYVSGLSQGMQELGYVEGRNLEIVYRYADGDVTRLPRLADEVVKRKPEVVVCGPTAGVLAVKRAAPAIPIVGAAMTDPVGFGVAASHARPGGQVTGILITLDTLPGKQLELVLELMRGRAKRIGLLSSVTNPIGEITRRNAETAAAALAVELVPVEVRVPDDLDGAFRKLVDERVEIVLVLQEAMFLSERRRIAALAAAARLPSMYSFRDHVVDGGLMSYGTSLRDSYRRSATYVDKILKGAAPGELPIELPTRLELVVNLRTAKALGLTIPESFLLRADEVIE